MTSDVSSHKQHVRSFESLIWIVKTLITSYMACLEALIASFKSASTLFYFQFSLSGIPTSPRLFPHKKINANADPRKYVSLPPRRLPQQRRIGRVLAYWSMPRVKRK
ncbi:hypothetical protein JAAARDRAFT_68541 [Jaapia argillacea MUCL 33604]|uniref:Uncharacterized protein n=1 Tax=Jaapia argillacea MUCL 33604 TaxID=933084 RepID=A0A067PYL3_9AGAM|nr:hypothetical protein JAAARDRAFT_68541 [Jaapia argillacea MUCL 33604]